MGKIIRVFISVILSIVFIVPLSAVVASDDDVVHEVLVTIDESAIDFNGFFDEIGHFNKQGLAIVGKKYDGDQTIDFSGKGMRYGVINLNGEILVDPIYHRIQDFNDTFWSVLIVVQGSAGETYTQEGLISKETGFFVLEPIYTGLPDLTTDGPVALSYRKLENVNGVETYVQHSTIKNIVNGKLRDVVIPNGIDLSDYAFAGINSLAGYNIVEVGGDITQNGVTKYVTKKWFVDDNANYIPSKVFDGVNGYVVRSDGVLFLQYNIFDFKSGNITQQGLLKLSRDENSVLISEVMTNVSLSIDYSKKRAYFFDKSKNKQRYFDMITETYHDVSAEPDQGNVVIDCRWRWASGTQFYKCGMNSKDGTVILEPVYDGLEYLGNGYIKFAKRNNDTDVKFGLIDESGRVIVNANYFGARYLDDLKIIQLDQESSVKDETTGKYFNVLSSTLFDTLSGKITANDVTYINFQTLALLGFSEVGILTGIGRISGDDRYGFEKFGIVSRSGELILDVNYDSLVPLFDWTNRDDKFFGLFQIGYTRKENCEIRNYDASKKAIVEEKWVCELYYYGIFSTTKGMILEPTYTTIHYNGSDTIMTELREFKRTEVVRFIEDLGRDEKLIIAEPRDSTYGLLDLKKGTVLPAIYAGFSAIDKTTPNLDANLPFDEYGLAKIYRSNFDGVNDDTFNYSVGLISRNGIVVEANYEDAYRLGDYYYLKNWDDSWEIINVQDPANKIEIDSGLTGDTEIWRVSLINDTHILVSTKAGRDISDYSRFGVIDRDLSVFLPIEYSDIKYDGTYWYLERYIENSGTYQYAVMNSDKTYAVEFTSRYDSISEFVGEYAVGTAGKPSTASTSSIRLLGSTKAKKKDFVLEIINKDGWVVGDFSDEYQMISLIGVENNEVKAIVKKDGEYYFAYLTEGPGIIDTRRGDPAGLVWIIMTIIGVAGFIGTTWLIKRKPSKLLKGS